MLGAILPLSKGGRLALAALLAAAVLVGAYAFGRHHMALEIEADEARRDAAAQTEVRKYQDETRKATDDDLCRRLSGKPCNF